MNFVRATIQGLLVACDHKVDFGYSNPVGFLIDYEQYNCTNISIICF